MTLGLPVYAIHFFSLLLAFITVFGYSLPENVTNIFILNSGAVMNCCDNSGASVYQPMIPRSAMS